MIPTVILVGLMAALAAGTRFRLVPLAAVGAVVAVSWGLLVASEGAFVGGTVLAVPNFAVGVLMGLSVRHLVTCRTSTKEIDVAASSRD